MGYSLRRAGTFTDLWERVSRLSLVAHLSGMAPTVPATRLPISLSSVTARLSVPSPRKDYNRSLGGDGRCRRVSLRIDPPLFGVARTQAPGTPFFVTPGVSCATARGERWETMYLVTASLSRTGCETGVDWNGRGTTEGERPAAGRLDLALATTRAGDSTGTPRAPCSPGALAPCVDKATLPW
jgi:hypothetical protein